MVYYNSMTSIDISNINRDALLEALWQSSKPAAFFQTTTTTPPQFSLTEAKSQLGLDGYADYICGRVIKINVYSGDSVDPSLYDRDIGQGACQRVVDSLR